MLDAPMNRAENFSMFLDSKETRRCFVVLSNSLECTSGFIRVREMSGKFKFFQGQGIVREFYVVSVKNRHLLKCQGNVREFYNFSLYQMMRNRNLLEQFS